MLCAHTVRRLKPGMFDQFAEAFQPSAGEAPPPGWVRFVLLRPRATVDEDIVVTFGFFDGTLEELEASQVQHGYADRVKAAQPYVDFVVASGVYDVALDLRAEGAAA